MCCYSGNINTLSAHISTITVHEKSLVTEESEVSVTGPRVYSLGTKP